MKCRICESNNVNEVFNFGMQPIAHNLLEKPHDKEYKHLFTVEYCFNCSFMQIANYIKPQKLYVNYFTISSWKPQPHANHLIKLIEKYYNLNSSTKIFEIGTNDGSFLDILKNKGYENFSGIEPTVDSYKIVSMKHKNIINDFYGFKKSIEITDINDKPKIIISRQVIEHVPDLDDFMSGIKFQLNENGILVLEFPDHSMNYENYDYTFWEEHVNYFTLGSIRNLLNKHGFSIVHHESTLFSGKCLFIIAEHSKKNKVDYKKQYYDNNILKYINNFTIFKSKLIDFFEKSIIYNNNNKIIMYGSGARSINFINLLNISDYFDYFVDDQFEKQQKIVPGCKLLIKNYIMNDFNKLIAMGVNAENEFKIINKHNINNYFSILPPSINIPRFWKEMRDSNE